jgi:hypothetical protein
MGKMGRMSMIVKISKINFQDDRMNIIIKIKKDNF